MLGTIGNSIAVVMTFTIICGIAMQTKKLSDVAWIPLIVMAALFGFGLGLIGALVTGTLPTNGKSQACEHYEYRGRGLECVD